MFVVISRVEEYIYHDRKLLRLGPFYFRRESGLAESSLYNHTSIGPFRVE